MRILTASVENVRKVPVSALFPLPGSAAGGAAMAVYVIEAGRARLTAVRLGGRNESEAWVQDGLAAGARVVLYPSALVRDGARIRVRSVARSY